MISSWLLAFSFFATVHGRIFDINNDNGTHDHGTFKDPSGRVRPRFRYWLPDAAVNRDSVKQDIASAGEIGAGGVEFLPFYNYGGEGPPGSNWAKYGFGSPAFIDLLRDALATHQQHGMYMDFALGPNQGQGVPASSDDDGLQWDLIPFNSLVPSNGSFDSVLPGWRAGELVALVSGIVTTRENMTRKLSGVFAGQNVSWSRWTLQHDSLSDISSNASDPSGRVSLSFAPTNEGQSRHLFAYYQARTLDKNLDLTTESTSYMENGSYSVDHFSSRGAETIIDFWETHILPDGLDHLLTTAGNYGWEDSVEVSSNISWTPLLPSRFREQLNYDISKYLPVIMFENNNLGLQPTTPGAIECVLDTPDQGLGVRNDYRQVIQAGYQEYIKALTNWTNTRLNLQFSSQPGYNLPVEMASTVPNVDAPECESLGFLDRVDAYRQFSGPAYLAGKRVVSNELGAVFLKAYSYTIPELLFSFNRAMIGGVNQVVLHGQSYTGNYEATTWPGYTAFQYSVSELYSNKQPSWNHGLSEAMDYMARIQFLQQQGVPRTDVVFLRHESATNTSFPRLYEPTDLESEGWTYNYISPSNLELPQAHARNGALAPDGPAWKSLVVDGPQGFTTKTLSKLNSLASSGLPIFFRGPKPTLWATGSAYDDDAFEEELAKLLDLPTVRQIGNSSLTETLRSLFLKPRVTVDTNGTWYTTWRDNAATDSCTIFILNDSPYSTGSITVSGRRVPYFLDPWKGDSTPLPFFEFTGNDSTKIPLRIAGNQTFILELRDGHEGSIPPHLANQSEDILGFQHTERDGLVLHVAASQDIPASFGLSNWALVAEHWEHPDNMTNADVIAKKHNTTHVLDRLVPWTEMDALVNVSGVGYYTTHFNWPPTSSNTSWLGAYLAISEVSHAVQVSINGQRIPPLDCRKAHGDITDRLIGGRNEVLVVVPTTMWNYIRSIWDNIKSGGAEIGGLFELYGIFPPLVPNGLVGEVEIVPYRKQVLSTS